MCQKVDDSSGEIARDDGNWLRQWHSSALTPEVL